MPHSPDPGSSSQKLRSAQRRHEPLVVPVISGRDERDIVTFWAVQDREMRVQGSFRTYCPANCPLRKKTPPPV